MRELTRFERMSNMIHRKPIDRIPVYEHFWDDTLKAWAEKGKVAVGEDLADHFGFDMSESFGFNMMADIDFTPQVVEETDETRLIRDGNGALLRRHKLHDTTPEHVDFAVKSRAAWEELIKPKLKVDRRRIDFGRYRTARDAARGAGRFFCWSGLGVFELMHPVCGHENLLVGMALDPDWVRDMARTYARFVMDLQEILFSEEGQPDGIYYYEDMGFKEHPFFSPDMYKEILQDAHMEMIADAKGRNLPVIMHSCGFVEPLVPLMIESGIDCLQVIEVKAGMDLLRLCRAYGDRLSFMGGLDVRAVCSNDRSLIDVELELKIPSAKAGYGFCLHSDHSIPKTVEYETYRYFLERGLELGVYGR